MWFSDSHVSIVSNSPPSNQPTLEQIRELMKSAAAKRWDEIAEKLPDLSQSPPGEPYTFDRIGQIREEYKLTKDCLQFVLNDWKDMSPRHTTQVLYKVLDQVKLQAVAEKVLGKAIWTEVVGKLRNISTPQSAWWFLYAGVLLFSSSDRIQLTSINYRQFECPLN